MALHTTLAMVLWTLVAFISMGRIDGFIMMNPCGAAVVHHHRSISIGISSFVSNRQSMLILNAKKVKKRSKTQKAKKKSIKMMKSSLPVSAAASSAVAIKEKEIVPLVDDALDSNSTLSAGTAMSQVGNITNSSLGNELDTTIEAANMTMPVKANMTMPYENIVVRKEKKKKIRPPLKSLSASAGKEPSQEEIQSLLARIESQDSIAKYIKSLNFLPVERMASPGTQSTLEIIARVISTFSAAVAFLTVSEVTLKGFTQTLGIPLPGIIDRYIDNHLTAHMTECLYATLAACVSWGALLVARKVAESSKDSTDDLPHGGIDV